MVRHFLPWFLAALPLAAPAATPAAGLPAVAPTAPPVLTPDQLARCATLGAEFARTGQVLKMYRAYKAADGSSKIEKIDLKGDTKVFYDGKVSLTQYGFGDPTAAVIVYGHPNMDIPPHPSPYREIFLIVSGSSTVSLPDGTRYELTPGSMLLSEDQGGSARGGSSGPCGYVAIDFQYKPVQAR